MFSLGGTSQALRLQKEEQIFDPTVFIFVLKEKNGQFICCNALISLSAPVAK